MLSTIAENSSLEEAAAHCAGNWKKWRHFMWFGENEFSEPEKIMLGYTTGPQTGVEDLANHEVVAETLAPYMGMAKDPTKTADDFSASLCGDLNALRGFMVRVYDTEGNITEVFKKLHELALEAQGCHVLDREIFNKVNRQQMLSYLNGHLPYLCKQRDIPYSEDMLVPTVDALLEDEEMTVDRVDDDDILDVLGVEVEESEE